MKDKILGGVLFRRILVAVLSLGLVFGGGAIPAMATEQEVSVGASDATTTYPSLTFDLDYTTHAYTGSELKPAVKNVKYKASAKDSTVNLTESETAGYEVEYEDNTNVGTATVTVTGTGSYSEAKAEKTFKITTVTPTITFNNSSINKAYSKGQSVSVTTSDYTISGVDSSANLGEPTITYKKGGKTLAEGETPSEVGTYTATVSYAATYADEAKKVENTKAFSKSVTINITAKSLTSKDISVTLDPTSYDYDGKEKKPEVTVSDNGETLDSKDTGDHKTVYDYSVSYRNNKASGTAYVDITGHGNYTGTISKSFKINDTDISKTEMDNLTISFKDGKESYDYTGKEIKPTVIVKNGDTTLKLNTDYTVSYENNIEPANSTDDNAPAVVITGKGSYKNSTKKTFTINQVDLEGVTISTIKDQTYTGAKIVPEITVKKGSATLRKDIDYTVDSNMTDSDNGVGTYKVTIKPTDDTTKFTGTREAIFKVVAKSISDAYVTLDKDAWDYTGSNITPEPKVEVTLRRGYTATLVKDTDYTVTYSNNVKAGTGTVTITGKGNYTGTVKKTFTIGTVAENGLSAATFKAISDQTYDGKAKTPSPSVTLNGKSLSSSNYTVSYMNNINAGTATLVITGKGSYTGTAQTTFKILPRAISSVTVTGLTAQKYTGYAVTPSLTLTYNGMTLKKDTDYTLVFTNNVNLGNGTVTINGLGNYTGVTTKTFPITEQGTTEENQVYATSVILPTSLDVTSGSTVTITPSITAPEDANTYKIRWETTNSQFVFVDGSTTNTAQTTDGTPAVVRANATEGSTVITASLIGEDDGQVKETHYVLVKVVKSFSDATSGYYATAVSTLANYGYLTGTGASQVWHSTPVVNGKSTTTFDPNGQVTRGEFVTMLYNKAVADYQKNGGTDPTTAAASGFSDVTSGAFYEKAVNWASANGIAYGKSSTSFDPNGTVTRAEAVTFLKRYLGGADATSTQFTDVDNAAYYAGSVGWAVNNGVTYGKTSTTFEPGTKCSRAEAATFIYRAAF